MLSIVSTHRADQTVFILEKKQPTGGKVDKIYFLCVQSDLFNQAFGT